MNSLSPQGMALLNISCRNVLQTEARRLKVTDFGLSKITQAREVRSCNMSGGTGSYRYMAPEVYRRKSYGKGVDIFSFALIVHQMFQGPSQTGEDPEKLADKRAYEDNRPYLSFFVYPPTNQEPQYVGGSVNSVWVSKHCFLLLLLINGTLVAHLYHKVSK